VAAQTNSGDINGAANVSTFNQYVVMGPDQSVMLRLRVGTCTNGQAVTWAATNFTATPVVFLSYVAAQAAQTNSPFATGSGVAGFTANGAAGLTMNWLAIGAH
jgi:hypothetical protein